MTLIFTNLLFDLQNNFINENNETLLIGVLNMKYQIPLLACQW